MKMVSHLLMIKPVNFGFNPETAVNNTFQVREQSNDVQKKALKEFEYFVRLLTTYDIDVTVIDDTPLPYTPDSIFPNNWVSFHEGGVMCLYPMFAPNRRMERKPELVATLQKKFHITTVIDLTRHEEHNRFLEGTGSMVLDRQFKIAYACISPRTSIDLLDEFCSSMHFLPVAFNAFDDKGGAIYHTNVMMCVTKQHVIICLESITDAKQRENVISAIKMSGKKTISITREQMKRFAGNMLQVTNKKGKAFLLMSMRAYESLSPGQIKGLERYNTLLPAPLDTIENNGGGSARCMVAEVFT